MFFVILFRKLPQVTLELTASEYLNHESVVSPRAPSPINGGFARQQYQSLIQCNSFIDAPMGLLSQSQWHVLLPRLRS